MTRSDALRKLVEKARKSSRACEVEAAQWIERNAEATE